MAEELAFPRLIYRGDHDALGSGSVGENKVVSSQDALDVALKEGWRLTSAIPEKPAKTADGAKDKK